MTWILIRQKPEIPTHALFLPGQNPHLPEAEGVELRFLHNHSWFFLHMLLREGLKKKIRNYLGIFPKFRAPPPHPPLLGTPRPKKNFMVYFAF